MLIVTTMLVFLAALAALAGFTRADCEACIDGRCHSRNTIISGFPITDQMAIDSFDNILYLQLNGNMNVAISLDHHEISLINMMNTTGIVFDDSSRELYLGTKEIPRTFYTYDRTSNTTKTNPVLNVLHPDLQDYSGHNLLLMMTAGARDWHYPYLKNLTINGLSVNTEHNQVYFVSNNTLYVHENKQEPAREILRRDHMVLSTGKTFTYENYKLQIMGELIPIQDPRDTLVYIGDATEKVIYKLDTITEELNVYAAYKTGAVAEFIFGKYDQLLTRDEDGSVVQWVPTRRDMYQTYTRNIETMRCVIDPPSPNFSIRQLDPNY